jgi:deoxyuridine 5'-triphosphate nucleotidohydrolase
MMDADQSSEESYMRYGEIFRVRWKQLHPDAQIPMRGSLLSAGFDLYCVADQTIYVGATVKIPLGFSTEMPPQIHGRIEARSGLALKGLAVVTGVIDADYRGEWCVIMHYLPGNAMAYRFAKGDKVAQCVFRPTLRVAMEAVSELSDSARGVGGFGSTGR